MRFRPSSRVFPLLAVLALWLGMAPPAQAVVCTSCACVTLLHNVTRNRIETEGEQTRAFITAQFKQNQRWLNEDFFTEEISLALQGMTEQLVVNGLNQMMAIGTFLDAKHQMETQRLMQERTADAHRDYQPTTDACVWGTAVQHIAPAYARVGVTAHVLAQRSMDRQLGNGRSSAAEGPDIDRISRVRQVREVYCNPGDNMQQTQYMCGTGGPAERRNKDIDYGRVMDGSLTLGVDFTDTAIGNDEQDIFALSNYLYAHQLFSRIPLPIMTMRAGQEGWMDMRSVVAKRGVAENSFNNIIGLKSMAPEATADSADYLAVVLQRMGVSVDDAKEMVGARPSYFAMMNILSQSIYQTPSFYVNLYDKPVNVERKDVGMQAINLMLDRDTYVSELRMEAVLSQLLETEVSRAQDRVQNAAGMLKRNERKN